MKDTTRTQLKLRLQLFADDPGQQNPQENQNNAPQGQNQQAPAIDYDKLASIINGKQTVTEDTVLKNYFRQQGLSQEELNQAIATFKEEKAKRTPDVGALQNQLTAKNEELMRANINYQATMEAVNLGLDAKSIPYVVKLADMGKAVNEDGSINAEEIKKALEKVLTDVPALKGTVQQQSPNENLGGFQIGGGTGNNNNNSSDDELRKIFGIRK